MSRFKDFLKQVAEILSADSFALPFDLEYESTTRGTNTNWLTYKFPLPNKQGDSPLEGASLQT